MNIRVLPLLVVTLSGFIALSYEILWYRVCTLASGGTPVTFGVLLAAYLLGLALGALGTRPFCREARSTGEPCHLRALAGFLAAANLVAFLVAPSFAWVAAAGPWVLGLPLVALAAALLGAVLPLISHYAIPPDDRAGARLSYLYLGNILGSAAGSLVTGFVLLDQLSFLHISALLAALGFLFAGLLLVVSTTRGRGRAVALVAALSAALLPWLLAPALHRDLYERLILRTDYRQGDHFARVVENRHGVIAITDEGTVYGAGVYDGRISTNLVHDTNWIVRPYALAAFHPAPREALLIGLSCGPWAQVVAHLPGLQRLTVVEIDPGYLEVIPHFPEVASLLRNPRVEVVIDDGRRWLSRHPGRQFDLIVQNTTWHWRSHITNLLSREYLELCRQRLRPGGLILLNTTWSDNAMRTALEVFPHGLRLFNCMLVGDQPVVFDRERWRRALSEFKIDGRPVLDLEDPEHGRRLEALLALGDTLEEPPGSQPERFESRESLWQRLRQARVITDDNMLCEMERLRW